jgi:geranylgeranyl diphosphate synthase type II
MDELKKIRAFIEEALDALISEKKTPYSEIFTAAKYSTLQGGKRLRPCLAIITAKMFGSTTRHALIPSLALELVHTYSLIHDDLPCMDDDDFRRGKPSLHKAFKEGIAVLTGDYLLTYAFEIIAETNNITPEQKLQLISVLAKSSGADGMIGGQVMDISNEDKSIDLAILQEIHTRKTGKLIAASLEFGAIIGNASIAERKLLEQFGLNIGLAFQIVDDILDVTSSKEKHGREVASDLINGKTTYVSLLGIEGSKKLAESLTSEALGLLQKLSYDSSALKHLAETLVNRSI